MNSLANVANRPKVKQRLSPALWCLARLMRSMPTDIRRVDVLWRALYDRIGGGAFAPDKSVDGRWPAGLQSPIRGRQHGLLMRLDLGNWSDRRAYFSGGYYQQDIARLLLQLLCPGDQYVDIGANIGMTALLAESRIGPTGKGLAFEPNPVAFARLKEHLEMNGVTNFELVPCAVADCDSTGRLFVPEDETLLGTLAPHSGVAGRSVEVRTVRAESYLSDLDRSNPTLIKIDVEGYEVQVLGGIQSLLDWPEVALVAEIGDEMLRHAGHSRDELHALLADHGFQPFEFAIRASRWRKQLELRPLSGPLEIDKYDALFVRPKSEFYRRRIAPLLRSATTV